MDGLGVPFHIITRLLTQPFQFSFLPPSLPPSLPSSPPSARAAEALQKGVAALGSELEGGREGGWACLFKLKGDLLTLAALLPEESGVR